jgi:hypothetical protein
MHEYAANTTLFYVLIYDVRITLQRSCKVDIYLMLAKNNFLLIAMHQ